RDAARLRGWQVFHHLGCDGQERIPGPEDRIGDDGDGAGGAAQNRPRRRFCRTLYGKAKVLSEAGFRRRRRNAARALDHSTACAWAFFATALVFTATSGGRSSGMYKMRWQ